MPGLTPIDPDDIPQGDDAPNKGHLPPNTYKVTQDYHKFEYLLADIDLDYATTQASAIAKARLVVPSDWRACEVHEAKLSSPNQEIAYWRIIFKRPKVKDA